MVEITVYKNIDYDNSSFEGKEQKTQQITVEYWGKYIKIGSIQIVLDANVEYNSRLDIYYEMFETYVVVQIGNDTWDKLVKGELK